MVELVDTIDSKFIAIFSVSVRVRLKVKIHQDNHVKLYVAFNHLN